MEAHVLLHNIRSTHNVGSIFRTADAAGVKKVFLSGYTPTPFDRFGREQKDIAKTALGAQKSLDWEYAKKASAVISDHKARGWRIVAVEQDEKAIDYRNFKQSARVLFVLGNEVRGLSRMLLCQCDEILEIPMRGKKESLNVSVAAGVVLFRAIQ